MSKSESVELNEADASAPLPPIPAKRYFTIGEVSELCLVKAHVLRYWEQEFTQLKPLKRSGNRRYYQHHEVLLIRRIRELLYEQGFTIQGARNRLESLGAARRRSSGSKATESDELVTMPSDAVAQEVSARHTSASHFLPTAELKAELLSIREALIPSNLTQTS